MGIFDTIPTETPCKIKGTELRIKKLTIRDLAELEKIEASVKEGDPEKRLAIPRYLISRCVVGAMPEDVDNLPLDAFREVLLNIAAVNDMPELVDPEWITPEVEEAFPNFVEKVKARS